MAQPIETDRIDAVHRRWTRCIQEREVAEIAAAFAADATLHLPNRPPISGAAAIAEAWARMLADPGTLVAFREGQMHGSRAPDQAYFTGDYLLEFDGPCDRVFDEGTYMGIWRKRDAEWRLVFLQARHRSSGAVVPGQALRPRHSRVAP